MRTELLNAVDAFDRAVASSAALIGRERIEPIAEVVMRVRRRAGYLGDTVLVALAGGTGSGKSSLVNALAGEEVSPAGGMRPTTSAPVAWIPENPEPGLMRLLDDLGVEARWGHKGLEWLAILDLPDTDSVVPDHRHTVEALLPQVDLVTWVVDPEKYQDRALHQRYLEPLSAHHRQYRFVLNKIDRLPEGRLDDIVADFTESLRSEGIPDPIIIPVAADPEVGPPIGIDELIGVFEETIDVKRDVYGKLATDLRTAGSRLATEAELDIGLEFTGRWQDVAADAAAAVTAGESGRARQRIDSFVADIAAEASATVGERVREAVPPDLIDSAVAASVAATGVDEPTTVPEAPVAARVGWWIALAVALISGVTTFQALRSGGEPWIPLGVTIVAIALVVGLGIWRARWRGNRAGELDRKRRESLRSPVADELDARVGRALRGVLRERAVAAAALTEARLTLHELESKLLDHDG
ncbi:MAG: hypothetical protein GEU79_10100 [Acidimicrobiia bacterium]|nr:hypothetical protein [Acidimicrobiia bacterium]